jgi:tetratricopeptide (TPR) repeat protein
MKRSVSVTAACLLLAPFALADSVASKNKAGNRLFAQGKYQDAEKAYLEARSTTQERPEITYNLGNALIKQKKYDQALQSLRQAVSKGDQGLQVNSWYNAGNALFDMGNFKDSAQAYIQALRLNPADRDAKHNLELALKKLHEQEKQQQDQQQNPDRQKPEGSGQNQAKDKNEPKPPDKKGQQPPPQDPQGQNPANPQSSQSQRPEGSFSKERALQILDALQNQELAEQRRLLERQARKKASGRDW